MWIRTGLIGVVLLGGLAWTVSSAHAICSIYGSQPTFTANETIADPPCDLNGNQYTTLGTLLNTEVPATMFRYISTGTGDNEHTVKATPGTIFSITATNTAATVAFLKCENDTAANTAANADTPEFSVAIPGATTGAGVHLPFPLGFAFSNAWTCWIVTGAADLNDVDAAADTVMVNYTYK